MSLLGLATTFTTLNRWTILLAHPMAPHTRIVFIKLRISRFFQTLSRFFQNIANFNHHIDWLFSILDCKPCYPCHSLWIAFVYLVHNLFIFFFFHLIFCYSHNHFVRCCTIDVWLISLLLDSFCWITTTAATISTTLRIRNHIKIFCLFPLRFVCVQLKQTKTEWYSLFF